MTRQEEFNRIKAVIEHPENSFLHIHGIGNMIRTFRARYKNSNLGIQLEKKKLELIKKLK